MEWMIQLEFARIVSTLWQVKNVNQEDINFLIINIKIEKKKKKYFVKWCLN